MSVSWGEPKVWLLPTKSLATTSKTTKERKGVELRRVASHCLSKAPLSPAVFLRRSIRCRRMNQILGEICNRIGIEVQCWREGEAHHLIYQQLWRRSASSLRL